MKPEADAGIRRRTFLIRSGTVVATALVAPKAWGREPRGQAAVRYPDPAIVPLDPRFPKYCQWNAAVERLWTGARFAEGPVWFGDGRYLLFSDIPNDRILRWTEETGKVSVFRHPSHKANGNTRDRQGRLVTCEHVSRRVTRTEFDGTVTVLMDRFQGQRLNAPNDVVVHSNGGVWFTDPTYGIRNNYGGNVDMSELPTHVYRFDPTSGESTVAVGDLVEPNGLCFSPDERLLYVVETAPADGKPVSILVFDVIDGRKLANRRVFCEIAKGGADGIRCDVDGNLWTAAGGGEGQDAVRVFASDGTLIGKVLLPEVCANLCFGGSKRNRLFLAASQSLYAVYVNTQGAQVP